MPALLQLGVPYLWVGIFELPSVHGFAFACMYLS